MNAPRVSLPRVSIGMPVYNGEKHLEQAVDSLLGQTLRDLELIISDNASTDRTQEICTAIAARDRRVRYIRQPRNMGAARNWNIVVEEARGQYFKWASANDYCAPTMLERCVATLDAEPGVAVCYGRTMLLDDESQPLGEYPFDLEVLDARPSVRFKRLVLELRLNNAQAGMVRLDVLLRTGIERPFPAGDMGLMCELGLYGGFRRIPELLLYRRMGRESASRYRTAAELREFLDPAAPDRRHLVVWQTHWDYVRSVLRAPIAWSEKFAALRFIVRSVYWHRTFLWNEVRGRLRPRRAGE